MDKSFSLLDVLTLLLRKKKRIFVHFVIVSIIAVAVSLIIPKKYLAKTLFLPPHEETSSGGGLSLGAVFNLGSTPAFTPQQIESLLESRRIREATIREFDLIHVYEHEDAPNPTEKTLKKLESRTKLKAIQQTGLAQNDVIHYSLSVIDRDSVRAADMANFMITELNRVMDVLSRNQQAYTMSFIKERLDSVANQKAEAMAALADFQTRNKIYSPQISQQVLASVSTYAELQQQKMLSEIQKEMLLFDRGPESREVRYEERKIRELESRMREIEMNREPSVTPGLEHSIDLSHRFLEFYQESEVLVKLELLLRQQYEEARINSARLAPAVRIVDPAVPPEWKNSPKKAIIVLAIVGVYMIGLLIFTLGSMGAANASPDTKRKLTEFREALRLRAR